MQYRRRLSRLFQISFAVLVGFSLTLSTINIGLSFPVTKGRASGLKLKPLIVPQSSTQRRENELLVRFREPSNEHQKNAAASSIGARRKNKLRGASAVETLEVTPTQNLESTALQLMLDPAVEFAEPNFLITSDQIGLVTPNDARFNEQWSLRNIGDNGGQFGADIEVSTAWQSTTGNRNTVIAVIDSGIDFTHPDLVNNQWNNTNPINGDPHGWDFVTDTGTIVDEHGHGTAIAGIIAAQGNNSVGVSGVMWRASLMSLRVLDGTGSGDVAAGIEAIDYGVTHGAHVINLSWEHRLQFNGASGR